jgi:hypothetical protein
MKLYNKVKAYIVMMLACSTYTYNTPLGKASPKEGNNILNKATMSI